MAVDQLTGMKGKTRREFKKRKSPAELEREAAEQELYKIRVRLFPIWLRLVILVVLIFISLMSGAAVGYGVLGKGNMADVLKTSTWTHIYNLVNKE